MYVHLLITRYATWTSRNHFRIERWGGGTFVSTAFDWCITGDCLIWLGASVRRFCKHVLSINDINIWSWESKNAKGDQIYGTIIGTILPITGLSEFWWVYWQLPFKRIYLFICLFYLFILMWHHIRVVIY